MIVSKLSLEGRMKGDGAVLKLYLKLSIPLDAFVPRAHINLFPEEHLKVANALVHPLNPATSQPYHFTSPLLLSACRALNLPSRLPQSYLSEFSSRDPDEEISEDLTGSLSVIDGAVVYVLPSELPRHLYFDAPHSTKSNRKGAGNLIEKPIVHFVAALDLVLPLQAGPKFAPYTFSIPLPRCLSNFIKLRIYPPFPAPNWQLSTTPAITTHPLSSSATSSPSSSLSSLASEAEDLLLHGSFPSTNHLIIRFALPQPDSGSKRRRVAVQKAETKTLWTLHERLGTGEIQGTVQCSVFCTGLWYPGVATSLGLDIELLSPNANVEWLDSAKHWQIHGSSAYTGYNLDAGGAPPENWDPSRPPSVRSPSTTPTTPSTSSSLSSLLRAPLPHAPDMPDYTFERGSPTTSSAGTPTPSVAGPSALPSRQNSTFFKGSPTPSSSLTVHVNMTELGLSLQNEFQVQVSGQVTLSLQDGQEAMDLPYFNVLAAAEQIHDVQLIAEMGGLELISRNGSMRPLTTGTTAEYKVGFHSIIDRRTFAIARPNTLPSAIPSLVGLPNYDSIDHPPSPDPLESSLIPSVQVTITPLMAPQAPGTRCAVRVRIPARPSIFRSHLDFGLAAEHQYPDRPTVDVIYASAGSRVVNFEFLPGSNTVASLTGSSEEQKHWLCWVKLDLSNDLFDVSEEVEVVYMVGWDESRRNGGVLMDMLLPCFAARVGCMTIDVLKSQSDFSEIMDSNLPYWIDSSTRSAYLLKPYFFPTMRLSIRRFDRRAHFWEQSLHWARTAVYLLTGLLILGLLFNTKKELAALRTSLNDIALPETIAAQQPAFLHPSHADPLSLKPEMSSTLRSSFVPTRSTVEDSGLHTEEGTHVEDQKASVRDIGATFDLRSQLLNYAEEVMSILIVQTTRFFNGEMGWSQAVVWTSLDKLWAFCVTLFNYPLPP
ncbi:hypothetical protein SISSUDRAFT_1061335 [Sistotremastrum suecicum HHB10207 ss-3]|uniref:Uncharacterized protein n=1 Tax=Sistotremastrum suecicum HHB10207 ss-3 TaxID=1314776 RepID=A0A166E771_9AGAM|nr:hypothetical protein SISSUDRAFT_1061335 [Sistotremastrum suecicum HHB10207 ss-3]